MYSPFVVIGTVYTTPVGAICQVKFGVDKNVHPEYDVLNSNKEELYEETVQ
jgi:hypothetical protein